MRTEISKRYLSLKSLLDFAKLLLNFLLTKVLFWILGNFDFTIFNDFSLFVNIGPYVTQNFKTLFLPQITYNILKLMNLLNMPHQSTVFGVLEVLDFLFLTNF